MGGGPSGAVSWPSYMQHFHAVLLFGGANDGTVFSPGTNLNPLDFEVSTFIANNPYVNILAFDPANDLAPINVALGQYLNFINSLNTYTNFQTAFSVADGTLAPFDDVIINADVSAFDTQLTDTLVNQTIPRFQAGMLNIGAVNTSAFQIGQAIMYSFKARDVAKHASELRVNVVKQRRELVRLYVVQMLNDLIQTASMFGDLIRGTNEGARIKIAALNAQQEQNVSYRENQFKWRVDAMNYLIGAIGAISGGGQGHVAPKRQSLASALIIGNASGAAQGASVGGWQGAIVGSVIGMGLAAATR